MADEAMLRQELRERLVAAVGDLPAIYREPVILRDLRGLSTEEASTQLRVKDQTLKSRLHRGRLLLREGSLTSPTAFQCQGGGAFLAVPDVPQVP